MGPVSGKLRTRCLQMPRTVPGYGHAQYWLGLWNIYWYQNFVEDIFKYVYVCINLDPSVHWNATGEIIVGSQRASGGLPVVFQWLSSGLPVCSNYANKHWISPGTSLGPSINQCGSSGIPVYLWLQWSSSVFQLCKLTLDRHWNTTGC